jgi:hypothetical protein
LWDDHNIAHSARHQVTPSEVAEVVLGSETLFWKPNMAEKWAHEKDAEAFDKAEFDLSHMHRATVRRGEPKSSLAVRFDTGDLERLRDRADTEGVGVTQLVRRWVTERLDEVEPAGAVDDLMEGLERSLRAARALKRSTGRKAG